MKYGLSRNDLHQVVGKQLQTQYGAALIPNKKIIEEALRISEFPRDSIKPSDFCYNYVNKDPISMTDPMFEKIGRGLYMYLGRNYPYSGPVYWEPKGTPRQIVGMWNNGACRMNPNNPNGSWTP